MVEKELDINEVFDNIVLTEEKLSQKSYEEGFQEGIIQGNLEGYKLGYAKGVELGEELGNYYGLALINLNSTKSEKIQKHLQLLIKRIDEFPKINDPEKDLIGEIQEIRTQFKKIKAMLKLQSPKKAINEKDLTF